MSLLFLSAYMVYCVIHWVFTGKPNDKKLDYAVDFIFEKIPNKCVYGMDK